MQEVTNGHYFIGIYRIPDVRLPAGFAVNADTGQY